MMLVPYSWRARAYPYRLLHDFAAPKATTLLPYAKRRVPCVAHLRQRLSSDVDVLHALPTRILGHLEQGRSGPIRVSRFLVRYVAIHETDPALLDAIHTIIDMSSDYSTQVRELKRKHREKAILSGNAEDSGIFWEKKVERDLKQHKAFQEDDASVRREREAELERVRARRCVQQ